MPQVKRIPIDPNDYPSPDYKLAKKNIRYQYFGEADDYQQKKELLRRNGFDITKSIKTFLQWKLRTDKLPFKDSFHPSGIHKLVLDKGGIYLIYSNDGNLILWDIEIKPNSKVDQTVSYNRAMGTVKQ